jgi:sirohydrochlorin cobaltochelatase
MSSHVSVTRPGHPTQALLLVGHGSHISADAAVPVFEHAATIREWGMFDEVHEAFWKEDPPLYRALDLVESDDIYVVPMFLAEGYFTRQVVPRELGLAAAARTGARQRVRYCPAIGSHPMMAHLVLGRALAALANAGIEPDDASLVVIGHGTERHGASGGTTYRIRDELRDGRTFGVVECGFLDEPPLVVDVIDHVPGERPIVLVPYFLADGWHTGTTIPRDLGLHGETTLNNGRLLLYTDPVGTHPAIAGIALEQAAAAGARVARIEHA